MMPLIISELPINIHHVLQIFFLEKPFFCEFYVVNFRKCLQMKKFAIDDESL